MKTAQLVAIATATAITVPTSVAIITGTPVQFVPSVPQITLTEVVNSVWGYSGRTLGGIDSLTFNVWDRSVQLLADYTTVVEASKNLADQPVIETVSDPVPDLSTKLDSTTESLSQLSLNYQKVTSEVGLLGLKWSSLQDLDATQSLDELILALGPDKQLTWLTKAWGWPQLSTIVSQTAQAKENLVKMRQIVGTTGLQPIAYLQLKPALKNLESAQRLIGESSDTVKNQTVYGQYKRTQELTAAWNMRQDQLADLLAQGNKIPSDQLDAKASEATLSVLALNQIPHAAKFLAKQPKNKILDLIALVQANKALLAQDTGEPVVGTWLEENPLIVRTLVANPSAVTSQQVAVKYYLPVEVKDRDILNHDPDLEIKFDSPKGKYLVSGNLALASADAKTVTVKIADMWQFDQTGSTSNQIMTPQQRIVAFRQNTIPAEVKAASTSTNGDKLTSLSGKLLLAMGGIMVTAAAVLALLALSRRRIAPVRQFHAFSKSITSSDL